jgi:6,7-dimethyl-8-ribityllumazine synthase
MSLWGKTDTLASTPKYVARSASFDSASTSTINVIDNTVNILASATGFATGDAVKYTIGAGTVITGLTANTTYFTRVVGAGVIELYDTYDHAIAFGVTTGRLDITAVGVGTHNLQRTGAANVYGDHIYNGHVIVFIDNQEAVTETNKLKGLTSPGWWMFRAYTDAQSVVRYKTELLIAIGNTAALAGDQEDTITIDLAITIGTHPSNASVITPAPATFLVAATTNSTEPLTYQWQIQQSGAGAWADVAGAVAASYTTDATAVADGVGATNGDKFACIVSTGGISVTSNSATLTVTDV